MPAWSVRAPGKESAPSIGYDNDDVCGDKSEVGEGRDERDDERHGWEATLAREDSEDDEGGVGRDAGLRLVLLSAVVGRCWW